MIKDLAVEAQGATMGDLERSGGERSEALRKAAQARWAKPRRNNRDEGNQGKK